MAMAMATAMAMSMAAAAAALPCLHQQHHQHQPLPSISLPCYLSPSHIPVFTGSSLRSPFATTATPTNRDDSSLFRDPYTSDSLPLSIRSLLNSFQQLKLLADASEAVGVDVRRRLILALERVSMLYETATNEEAENYAGNDHSSLLPNLKVLQREYDSLHGVITMATEGGLGSAETDISDKGAMSLVETVDYEEEAGLMRRSNATSTVEVLTGPTYEMSIPQDEESSSQFSAVRAEIERRVTEQLIKTRFRQQRSSSNSEAVKTVPSNTASEKDVKGTIASSEDPVLGDHVLSQQEEKLHPVDDIQQLEARLKKLEMEKERITPLELHEKVVSRIDNSLFETHQQLSQISKELKQKEVLLVSFQENLLQHQNKLLEKVNQLRDEITCMCTEERMNDTIEKYLNGMRQELKDTHDQMMHLGLDFEKKMASIVLNEEHDKVKQQQFQNLLEELKYRLDHVDKKQELFNKQIALLDPESLNAFRKEQKQKNSQIEKDMKKIKQIEDSIQIQDVKLHELAEEKDRKVNLEEIINHKLQEALDELKVVKQSHNSTVQKSTKDESLFGQLHEEWKVFRKDFVREFNVWTTRMRSLEEMHKELQLENFIVEFRNMENRLTLLQEKQRFESVLLANMQKQIDMLESKEVQLIKNLEDEVAIQKQALLDDVTLLLTKSRLLKDEVQSIQQYYGSTVDELRMNVDESDVPISETGRLQMYDQRRVYLENFFTIMGHVISQEIGKINADATQHKETPKHIQGILLNKYKVTAGGDMDGIILFYKTNWKKAFLHCCPDNTQWTEVPGLPMEDLKSDGEDFKVLRIAAARVEFVVTDGEGNWDQAPGGCNYVLEGPGVFKLVAGVLNVICGS